MQCINNNSIECLPDIIECENLLEWNKYLNILYTTVFKPNFVETNPIFKGLKVFLRRYPMDNGIEHDFIHLTHIKDNYKSENPNDRIPDLRRSERLNWVKPIIEHFVCSSEKQCARIFYWENFYKNKIRCNLFLPEERFHVVLEKRENLYFIITSFYINREDEKVKRIKKYEEYKKQKTPLL